MSDAAHRAWLAHLSGRTAGLPPPARRDWRRMADLAELHRLSPLTYRRLADGPHAAAIPGPVRARLRAAYVDSAVRNALLLRHTAQVAAALRQENIDVILLKGIHLCRFVYAEPALRGMADVDILVPRDRLADAERVFLDRGFGPLPREAIDQRCAWSPHLAKLSKPGAPVFEVHWHVERPTSPFRIDLDGIWGRARRVELEPAGTPVLVMAPVDLLHHVALHGAYHHRFERSAFQMLADLHAIVEAHGPALDWEALADRANAWGTSRFVFTALRMAADVLGGPLPAGALARLSHRPEDEELAAIAREYVVGLGVDVPAAYRDLARARSWPDRLRHVARHAFPPPAELEEIYGLAPGTWLPPVYLRRVASLMVRRGGLLARALAGRRAARTARERARARDRIERWVGPVGERPAADRSASATPRPRPARRR